MPTRTTHILDAAEMMIDASKHPDIAKAKDLLKQVRKTYKSDIVTDAYDLLSDKVRAKLHAIMGGKNE